MHRITPAAFAASLLLLAMIGLVVAVQAAPSAEGSASAAALKRARDPGIPAGVGQQRGFHIYMSAAADGPQRRSFLSDTHQVYAVVAYEEARGDRLTVEMHDLAGTIVKRETVGPLSGTGKRAVSVSVDDFIASYKSGLNSQSNTLMESLSQSSTNCASRPPVPPAWPPVPPTAQPGRPTPTPLPPDPYSQFLDHTLQEVKTAQFVIAAITPTMKALQALPDLAELADINRGLDEASTSLNTVYKNLGQVEASLNPPQGRPDPEKGCQIINDAKAESERSLALIHQALNSLPSDTSAWRLPATSARYRNDVFQECVQYVTKLSGTTEASSSWTVGDPGPPALIFPRADLIDGAHVGQLSGVGAIYASSVTVANVSHQSRVGAFVTDAMCLPVDAVNITFGVDPSTAGSVAPRVVGVADGVAETTLQAGAEAARQAKVHGVVCVGPCAMPGPGTPAPVDGWTKFDVVGSAKRLDFKIVPRVVNPLEDESAGISVQVTDATTNGLPVADGTVVHIRIEGPGTLYYDRRPRGGGRPTPVALGKSAEVITDRGLTIVPSGDDPGFVSLQRLYLKAGSDGDGCLTISAEADGVAANTDAVNAEGQRVKTVCIRSTTKIYLPSCMKKYVVYATPSFLPTTTPEPLRSR